MLHDNETCSSCEPNPTYGCNAARQDRRKAYDVLKGDSAPQLTFVAAGSKKPQEMPHDLEGMSLAQMDQKIQELRTPRAKSRGPVVTASATFAPVSALNLQFVGATS